MTDQQTEQLPIIDIESLSHDARGVGRDADGKVTFVDFALPGERVSYQPTRRRSKYNSATLVELLREAPERVAPRCAVFGVCGGCALQHLAPDAQIAAKQQQLLDNLEKIAFARPEEVLAPLTGQLWGYRRKARLGARDVEKKGGIIVGFRERNHSFITPTDACPVLYPPVSDLLPAMRELIAGLSCRQRVPQIEVAAGDNATALVFRHLEPFNSTDIQLLTAFARQHGVHLYLQPGDLRSVRPLWPAEPEPLLYRLERYDVRLEFRPTDFIQVNAAANAALVDFVIGLLAPARDEPVLDLFCGLGNFTLPLARSAARVTGVEGDAGLVDRARHNQRINSIENVEFRAADLFQPEVCEQLIANFEGRVVLDPPRSGAAEVVKLLRPARIPRIVYVSCNPATLARDAEILTRRNGYRLSRAGVVDMFPHTAHVESVAVFDGG